MGVGIGSGAKFRIQMLQNVCAKLGYTCVPYVGGVVCNKDKANTEQYAPSTFGGQLLQID